MMLDAGFPASFPTGTGTTWYDVSGNDYVGNMVNGPSWTNSGTTSYINFDGSDDYVLVSNNANILSKTSYTKIAWFNASTFSTNNNIISGGNNGAHAFWLAGGNRLNAGHNGGWSTVQSTSTLSLNTWQISLNFSSREIVSFLTILETTGFKSSNVIFFFTKVFILTN